MKNLNIKKNYTRPTINKIGKIADLTLASGGDSCDNNGTVGSGTKPARCTS